MVSDESLDRFAAENFEKILVYLNKLHEMGTIVKVFRENGVTLSEYTRMLELLELVIEETTERNDLPILENLRWLRSLVPNISMLQNIRVTAVSLRRYLPKEPIAPNLYQGRTLLRNIAGRIIMPQGALPPPPPPTPGQIEDEIEALVDSFASELLRSTSILIQFFDFITPSGASWVVELLKKNPGNIRTTLGEALCIWWLQRVLGEDNEIWQHAVGPKRLANQEVDAIAANQRGLAVAEIKISKNKLEEACPQIIRLASFFSKPENLKQVFSGAKNCTVIEVAIVTLYDLGKGKTVILNLLSEAGESSGIKRNAIKVYDISDILKEIGEWKSSNKTRYHDLFKAVNGILETV